jgi:hypothetical protein
MGVDRRVFFFFFLSYFGEAVFSREGHNWIKLFLVAGSEHFQ